MTIAVLVKVNDGLVLASDSATTLATDNGAGQQEVQYIYNNANKVFNLHKGLPIGALTFGLGSIGPASISFLSKELRRRLMGRDEDHLDWTLDPSSYTIRQVVERVQQFFYDEKYLTAFPGARPAAPLGLVVGGYSTHADLAEAYLLQIDGQSVWGEELLPGSPGAAWWGQPEAITRLFNGVSGSLGDALVNLGVPADDAGAYVDAIASEVALPFVMPAMPVKDAIDLAEFLVDLTIKFVRFCPGDATVGGPIEVAAITKHEDFKWVARKHYYEQRLNPPEGS